MYPNGSYTTQFKKECDFFCILRGQPLFVACHLNKLEIWVVLSSRKNSYPVETFLQCPQTEIVVGCVRMWYLRAQQLWSPLQHNFVCFG